MAAAHNGFVTLRYGKKKPTDPGANLSLAAGQKITDLVFKLPRTASITGRVMDEDGQPLPNVDVKVYQASSRSGKSQLGAVGGASTNDLGEYRIFDLAPVPHFVRSH